MAGGRGMVGKLVMAAAMALPMAHAQASGSGRASIAGEMEAVRVFVDPANGDRWLLARNPAHPGGPGTLTMTGREAVDSGRAPAAARKPADVIRAGDRIVIEEHTAVVDARLAATALATAAPGETIPARLEIGGRIVQAVALVHGRARLAEGAEP